MTPEEFITQRDERRRRRRRSAVSDAEMAAWVALTRSASPFSAQVYNENQNIDEATGISYDWHLSELHIKDWFVKVKNNISEDEEVI